MARRFRVFFPVYSTHSVVVSASSKEEAKRKAEQRFGGMPVSHEEVDDLALGDAATEVVATDDEVTV